VGESFNVERCIAVSERLALTLSAGDCVLSGAACQARVKSSSRFSSTYSIFSYVTSNVVLSSAFFRMRTIFLPSSEILLLST